MTTLWDWDFGAGLVLGLSLSVASTVVLLRALEERNALETPNGRIAIGWLIVEDLAMVVALVLLPAFAEAFGGRAADAVHAPPRHGLAAILGITFAKVAAFLAILLLIGPRVLPWMLKQVARTGSRELFTLCVLAVAVGVAFGAAELRRLLALGAFLRAWSCMSPIEPESGHKLAAIAGRLAVLFFVSVGMLFDQSILVREPLMVAAVLLLIVIGKSLVALGIVLALGYPLSTALTVSASLAQIGEFSFILAGLGITYDLMEKEGLNLVLAGALFSITLNPLTFAAVDRLIRRVQSNPQLKRQFEEARAIPFLRLKHDLDSTREQAAKRAAAHKTSRASAGR
jgi:CPA2 family monovalent cation:H+ antiporter-2